MDQVKLTYVKLVVVALAVIGVFVLAAIGRIEPNAATAGAVTVVTGLVVALGISAGGSATASATTNASKLAIDAQQFFLNGLTAPAPAAPPVAPAADAPAAVKS